MATPRNVCHRCRHKWKVKKNMVPECPKCGWDNIGPTDPAPSPLGKLLVIGVIALVVLWKMGLIPGSAVKQAQDAVQGAVNDARKEVEKHLDDGDAKTKTKKTAPAPEAEKTAEDDAPPPAARKTAEAAKTGQAGAEAPPRPDVVVSSKLGAPTGSAYMVRGKLKNQGKADAKDVKVRVTFRDAAGDVLDAVQAECPRELAAGQSARFEAAIAGEKAKRVETFEAEVTFAE